MKIEELLDLSPDKWDELTDRQWEERKRLKDKAWDHAIRRDSMAEQGLKALLLLNGGGAVALLAFLQAIWIKDGKLELVSWIVTAMIFLVLGAASAGAVHFFRYWASMAYQSEGKIKGRKLTAAHLGVTICSFALFLVGMSVIIIGAFKNLPETH